MLTNMDEFFINKRLSFTKISIFQHCQRSRSRLFTSFSSFQIPLAAKKRKKGIANDRIAAKESSPLTNLPLVKIFLNSAAFLSLKALANIFKHSSDGASCFVCYLSPGGRQMSSFVSKNRESWPASSFLADMSCSYPVYQPRPPPQAAN